MNYENHKPKALNAKPRPKDDDLTPEREQELTLQFQVVVMVTMVGQKEMRVQLLLQKGIFLYSLLYLEHYSIVQCLLMMQNNIY